MRPRSTLLLLAALAAEPLAAPTARAQRAPRESASARPARTSIAGTVFDSLVANRPLAGASVWLVGTAYAALTDAAGRYRFDTIPPGRYTVAFSDATLDSLGISAPVVTVAVSSRAAPAVALATPSPAAFYAATCGSAPPVGAGVVLGVVRDAERAAPIAGATVAAEWAEWTVESGGVRQRDATVAAATGASGGYVLCGVPADAPFIVRARRGSTGGADVVVDLEGRHFALRDLRMGTAEAAAGGAGAPVLAGRVAAADDRPVARAQVGTAGSTVPLAFTDSLGAFTLTGLPTGTHTFEARALGFTPVRFTVDLRAGDTTRVAPRFGAPVVVLSRKTVTDRHPRRSLERRGRGVGRVVTGEEIARRDTRELADVLRMMPGLSAVRTGGGHTVLSRRAGGRCAPTYYVDGVEVEQGGAVAADEIITAADVEAVELYGSAAAPQTVRAGGCGALMIWTRDSLPSSTGKPALPR